MSRSPVRISSAGTTAKPRGRHGTPSEARDVPSPATRQLFRSTARLLAAASHTIWHQPGTKSRNRWYCLSAASDAEQMCLESRIVHSYPWAKGSARAISIIFAGRTGQISRMQSYITAAWLRESSSLVEVRCTRQSLPEFSFARDGRTRGTPATG